MRLRPEEITSILKQRIEDYDVETNLAEVGTLFDIDPSPLSDDLRTISDISFLTGTNGLDGRGMGLSNTGLLTFGLTFTDGSSGIFTAQVPEPSAVALVTLGLGARTLRRRTRRYK